MSYANQSELKLSLYGKLLKEKNNQETKIQEIELRLKLSTEAGEIDLSLDLGKSLSKYQYKLHCTEVQIQQLEKQINGGASLNPFLESKDVEFANNR